jgi:hypothetical protein
MKNNTTTTLSLLGIDITHSVLTEEQYSAFVGEKAIFFPDVEKGYNQEYSYYIVRDNLKNYYIRTFTERDIIFNYINDGKDIEVIYTVKHGYFCHTFYYHFIFLDDKNFEAWYKATQIMKKMHLPRKLNPEDLNAMFSSLVEKEYGGDKVNVNIF